MRPPEADSPADRVRVIVGGVGYPNLRDHSIGLAVMERLQRRTWPGHVSVEDLSYSYNPIALVQRLEDEPEDRRFGRVVLIAAAERPGRAPGTVAAYRWNGALPSPEVIQAAVAEAVTGVIALDNTLIIARHLGALPGEAVVVEVEPQDHEWGDELSAPVARIFEPLCEFVSRVVSDSSVVLQLERTPLGAGPPLVLDLA